MQDIRIAVVSMHSEPGDLDGNLKRTASFVKEASRKGADIVCFPELSISGYALDNPGRIGEAMPRQEILEQVTEMARIDDILVITGFIDTSDGEKPYISQMVAGPEGLMGIYRKTHLSPKEREKFRAGEEIPVYQQGGCRFGIHLCYEAHFPEITTVQALDGADIIFLPHASPRGTPEEKTASWLRHLPGRAFDNALFIVACNQVGETNAGLSFPAVALIIGPDGNVMANYGGPGEGMLTADLKGEALEEMRGHRMKYFLPNRRPHLYGPIIKKVH
jgi:N-carbamoylputrescine amidase